MRNVITRIMAAVIAAAFSLFQIPGAVAGPSVVDGIIEKAMLIDKEAREAMAGGNMDEATLILEKELEVLSPGGVIADYVLYGNAANQLAINYSQKKQWDAAILNEKRAITCYEKMKVDRDVVSGCKGNLAAFYFKRGQPGDLEVAIGHAEEALAGCKDSKVYFNVTNSLIVYYAQAGNPDKAAKLSDKILKDAKALCKKDTLRYAQILDAQSIQKAHSGDFGGAKKLIEECIAIYRQKNAAGTAEFARILMNAANFNSHQENYDKVVELLEEAKDILSLTVGKGSADYVKCLSELSSAYKSTGNLEKANDYVAAVLVHGGGSGADANKVAAMSKMKQASVFAGTGNYKGAVEMAEAALDIIVQYRDTMLIANMTNILSAYYNGLGDYEKAISVCKEAIGMYAQAKGHKSDEALAIGNMARYSYMAGHYDRAMEYGDSSIVRYAEAGDTLSSFYAKALGNYGVFCQAHGDLDKAIAYARRAYDIQVRMLGPSHPDNVTYLFNLAYFYDIAGMTDSMQVYYSKALRQQAEHVRRNFSHLSTQGREMYWSTRSTVFDVAASYAYMHHDNDSLLRDAYNASLFTKGILLNSEIDFRETLIRSGDTALLAKYNSLGEMVRRMEKTGRDEGAEAAGRLQAQIVSLEREIIRESRLFGDYTDNMSITIERLAGSLREGEAAVELFDIGAVGGHVYFALVMRGGWQAPRYAYLFSDSDLDRFRYGDDGFHQLLRHKPGIDHIFSSPEIGGMVWDKIIEAMGEGVRDIYFSPSGLFYQWGIEYLMCDGGRRINEMYGMHRLSSTRLLAQRRGSVPISSAVIYGGIDYDVPVESMLEFRAEAASLTDMAWWSSSAENRQILQDADRAACDTLAAARGSVGYLPGTSEEADSIAVQFARRGIGVTLFKENAAMEESFKALNGKTVSALHIATHGFALNENSESGRIFVSMLGESNAERDKSLNYSGLLFAGANNVLRGARLPDGLDNGILTAREISVMDLRELDLVVLSACKTGLGEIKEDGVFGLQRGFKKAGAHSILMSLWNVDDLATQIMMTHFYERLLEGVDRGRAFSMAQQSVRDHGFTEPYYWASFILLDDN